MSTYEEIRKRNVSKIIQEKQAHEREYQETIDGIRRGAHTVAKQLENILPQESYLRDAAHSLHSIQQGKEQSSEIAEIKLTSSVQQYEYIKGEPLPQVIIDRMRREMMKGIHASLDKMQRQAEIDIDSSTRGWHVSLNVLRKNVDRAEHERYITLDEALEARNVISTLDVQKDIKTDDGVNAFFSFLKSNESLSTFFSYFNNYTPKTLYSNKTEIKTLASLAKENVQALVDSPRSTISNPRHLNVIERDVLSYITYELEAWNAGKAEQLKDTGDIDYALFLEQRADESFALLAEKYTPFADVEAQIDMLGKEGFLLEDDRSLIHKKIRERFGIAKREQKEERTEEREYVELRSLVLQDDYGIPSRESGRIAQLITDEDVERVPRHLISFMKPDLVTLLLRENPNLFLLNTDELVRYSQQFSQLATQTTNFDIKDFNPYDSPSNFCSFQALYTTKKKLETMIEQATSEKQHISDVSILKQKLQSEGYDPDMTFHILHGFWFAGNLFQGGHRFAPDKLEKNVARGGVDLSDPETRRLFDRTKKALVSANAVMNEGGLSLNSHINYIQSEALQKAVLYIRQHHHSEYT